MNALALAAVVLTTTAAGVPNLQVASDRALAGEAARALDVRWVSDHAVYVTTYDHGLFEVGVSSRRVIRVPFSELGKKCPSCSRLGVSKDYIVTAFPAYQLAWKHRRERAIHNLLFASMVDLDVHGDRLLILGSRREGKEWAPDGAIAWMGSLGGGLKDLRPVLYSTLGPKARIVARCGFLEPGAARFFPDGSFVIVPGVEPDVYLYDRSAKLVHTWPTARLGFFDRCDGVPEAQLARMRAAPEARSQWMVGRTKLEDVLPTRYGPALLLQHVARGTTRWTMLILRRDGKHQRVELPFSAPTDVASIRGDVRGNRVAFVIRTFGEWRKGSKPVPSRLVIMELR